MFRNAITMTLASAALAAASVAHAQQAGAPAQLDINVPFGANEACAFPIEFRGVSKVKSMSFKGGRIITLFANSGVTVINLADPSKSVTLRGSGTFHDVVSPNGALLSTNTGHVYYVGGEFGATLTIGNFTYAQSADGELTAPLTGSGRKLDLCSMIE